MKIAWLIEKEDLVNKGQSTGKCLGVIQQGECSQGMFEWTTPEFAIHFRSKEDANAAAPVLLPHRRRDDDEADSELLPHVRFLVVEHSWSDPEEDEGILIDEVRVKHRLLWRNGKILPLEEADLIARQHGFVYVEQLIDHVMAGTYHGKGSK